MIKTENIRIRDPFVLPHDGIYYLYGTVGETEGERNLYVFKSTDLKSWEPPCPIFTLAEDGWAEKELWAPEVHLYKGRFYLFVSILGKSGLRGVQIAVSDSPDGRFVPVADRPATPLDKSCIDGTLYVEDGRPYIVYSRDWPDNFVAEMGSYVGQIAAVELKDDLSAPASEPFVLFDSCAAPLSEGHPARLEHNATRYGSDGPFLIKDENKLILLWSPIPDNNYIVASAVSDNGSIRGEWKHHKRAVFDGNGGHSMIFEDFGGNKKICMHYPEAFLKERPFIADIDIINGEVVIKEKLI